MMTENDGNEVMIDDHQHAAVDYMLHHGREHVYLAGEYLIRQGQIRSDLFTIVSGEVEVRLSQENGRYLSLARLLSGSILGEMSLIRNEPTSADVIALVETKAIILPGALFHTAIAECEPLRVEILSRLAQKVHDTSVELWSFFQRAETMKLLTYGDQSLESLIIRSRRMQNLSQRMSDLALSGRGVSISGGPGTGKLLIARTIHHMSPWKEAPCLVVDCQRLAAEDQIRLLFGVSSDAELFDSDKGTGALHLSHQGCLILQHAELLQLPAMTLLLNYLQQKQDGILTFPQTRVILTHSQESDTTKISQHLRMLEQTPLVDQLTVPSLINRKTDILPLARYFLDNSLEHNSKILTQDAEHLILNRTYNHRNAAELREMVEMAAFFAEEKEIREEHFFSRPRDDEQLVEYNLEHIPLVRRMLNNNFFPYVRNLVFFIFSLVIVLCLIVPQTFIGRLSNAFIWSVWEPLIIFSFLFLGHAWCTVCPLSETAREAKKVVCLGKPPPPFLKEWRIWLAVAGLYVIFWSENFFQMTRNPVASAILLLSLMGSAIVLGIIFDREVWCRYVCPLGFLASLFSPASMLHLRAKKRVCSTLCTTHSCYKGTNDEPGCPVFHHPVSFAENYNCKFCFECKKLCPHESISLYLRPLLLGVWQTGNWVKSLIPFALSLMGLSLVLVSTRPGAWLNTRLGVTMGTGVVLVVVIFLSLHIFRYYRKHHDGETLILAPLLFSAVIVAWGGLMVYQLDHISLLKSVVLTIKPGLFFSAPASTVGISLLTLLQVGILLFALILGMVAIWRSTVFFASSRNNNLSTMPYVVLAGCLGYVLFTLITILY